MTDKSQNEYREDLDDMLSLAENVDFEIKRLKTASNLSLFGFAALLIISMSAVVLAFEFKISNSERSEFINLSLGIMSAAPFILGAVLYSRALKLRRRARAEAKILNEVLRTTHGLLDSADLQFRPVEMQTYQMRMKRLAFESDEEEEE